jgi:hypothetical protein
MGEKVEEAVLRAPIVTNADAERTVVVIGDVIFVVAAMDGVLQGTVFRSVGILWSIRVL